MKILEKEVRESLQVMQNELADERKDTLGIATVDKDCYAAVHPVEFQFEMIIETITSEISEKANGSDKLIGNQDVHIFEYPSRQDKDKIA